MPHCSKGPSALNVGGAYAARDARSIGKVKEKHAPRPGALSTHIRQER